MADPFATLAGDKDDPGVHCFLVTKSDTEDMPYTCRALLCDADMTVKIITHGGQTIENYPLQKGYNPIRVNRVYSTGTDAGDIFAWY
jgi:hypothetical protein